MKNINSDCASNSKTTNVQIKEETTDLLIDSKRGHSLTQGNRNAVKFINGFKIPTVNQNGYTPSELFIQELRSQSLPDCSEEKSRLNGNSAVTNTVNSCDRESKLLLNDQSTLQCLTSDLWFKTWPERCDKQKSNDSSPDTSTTRTNLQENTQQVTNCDNLKNSNIKNKFTLNEALQNISLAYSPVTKQLHLVEKLNEHSVKANDNTTYCNENILDNKIIEKEEASCFKKRGHKRNEAGSFSSTVSTLSALSDPSTSGSLLDADERSLSSFDNNITKSRRKSLTNFFTRNVFSWKSGTNDSNTSNSVWKLFSKSSNDSSNSPLHVVASSSALIQLGRPSNLPAKTVEEELRHKEEYKAMIAAAKKREAQTLAAKQKLQKLQLQQEEQQAAATKHFTQKVLPNWDVMRNSKKTQDMWWQGLPSSVRGKVWRLAIGNELNVTSQLYDICLSRAQNRLNSPEPSHCESDIDQESSMNVIQLDISRTFPHLCIFQEGGPYSDVLHSLLAAYVCYRPDVGYVQGMSYIAAILILNMEQLDAFICFANLLNQPLHLSAFTLNQSQMQAYYNAYNQVFKYNLPKLHSHFEQAGLTPDLYLLDWIYTIYAKAMPLDVACRVWDILLRDGYEFIFRTALGILHLNQDILINMDFLHGAQFLTRLPDDMSSDHLFRSIQLVTTTIGKQCFSQIVDKCSFSMSDSIS